MRFINDVLLYSSSGGPAALSMYSGVHRFQSIKFPGLENLDFLISRQF
jgi:hypothetical protein